MVVLLVSYLGVLLTNAGGSSFDTMAKPIYGFTRDNLIPRRQITMIVELGEEPVAFQGHIDFLIMDSKFAYNRFLGRLSLKQLKEVTYINHLCINFETSQVIAYKLPCENAISTLYKRSSKTLKGWYHIYCQTKRCLKILL